MTSRADTSPRAPGSPLLWFAALGAPAAWALQFAFGYWLSDAQCGVAGERWGIALETWAALAGVAALAVAAAAGLTALALFRRAGGADDSDPPPPGRVRFLATVGIAVAPLFGFLIAMTAAGVVVLVPCTQAQPPQGIVHQPGGGEQARSRLGAGLYAANCASCHGVAGVGVPEPGKRGAGGVVGQGPPLVGVGALAPDFYLRTGRMPLERAGEEPERQRPFFNRREIDALVAYVASFGGGPAIPEPRPAYDRAAEGLSLFTEHCAGCHQVVGEGGYVPGARVPVLRHANATEIAEAVRIGPFLMPRFPKSQIDDRELDAIVAYVLASRQPEDRGGFGLGHVGPVPEGMVAWLVAAVGLVGVCALIGRRLA